MTKPLSPNQKIFNKASREVERLEKQLEKAKGRLELATETLEKEKNKKKASKEAETPNNGGYGWCGTTRRRNS